ncbi:hypothetical protein HF521_000297 [Silurus meridionalis]|uniref:Endonuclease/exonuclease/phosphatase domain-containing protein n=1 Tax=Silurus meridionalis TaxID=175797 RepID=A0A8T0BZJ3_SILME|nr:hypothetical protein HF521_000297 [Silurus meridionalis]
MGRVALGRKSSIKRAKSEFNTRSGYQRRPQILLSNRVPVEIGLLLAEGGKGEEEGRLQRQQEKEKWRRVEVQVGTLNVGTMTGKGREVADMMERKKVDMLCVQETKWKGSKTRNIVGGFKLFYHGVDGKKMV